MAPSWGFEKIPPAQPTNLSNTAVRSRSVAVRKSDSQLEKTTIQYAISYRKLHVLGLPSEVRDEIWQTIFDDITSAAGPSGWAQRPSTEYDGLSLTCHQIRDEIAFFWPRAIVQHNRITVFSLPNSPILLDFKMLTLEIPLNQNYKFFLAAAISLKHLAPVLEDLRIFFVGSDKFHIPLTLASCGLHDPNVEVISKRLTIDGQNHQIRQPLFTALYGLANLRSLVLSNHNYPIAPPLVLARKPYMRFLHVVTDSRTTVHNRFNTRGNGLTPLMIKPIQQGFPPVEVLNVSANASLNSLQLIGACTYYLKHLTWTVPDLSLQSAGGIEVDWYHSTRHVLYLLKNNASQLQTLRICIEETIYEADYAAGILTQAFELYLPHLPIETFELHVHAKSPWFGREIIRFLPSSVRRLYLSRELLDEDYLTVDIDSRYMTCHSTNNQNSSRRTSRFLKSLRGVTDEDCVLVGEDKNRRDFISMGGGKLGFVGYEYDPTKPTRFGNSKIRTAAAEETRTWMLTINGRLLDRERNSHLAENDGAKYIPPRQNVSRESKTREDSIAAKYGPLWVCALATVREKEAAAHEIEDSVIAQFPHSYFGNEEAAAQVFQNEPGVHPDDVLERLWPDEVSAHAEGHWQTDFKPDMRSGVAEEDGCDHDIPKQATNTGHSAWEEERTAHWVQNLRWYPQKNSYIKDEEREELLAERGRVILQTLEHGGE